MLDYVDWLSCHATVRSCDFWTKVCDEMVFIPRLVDSVNDRMKIAMIFTVLVRAN